MRKSVIVFSLVYAADLSCSLSAQQPPGDGPRYQDGTSLVRRTDYREGTFLGSGLGLTYETETPRATDSPTFTNVFVNPSSYRGFMQTGAWPNGWGCFNFGQAAALRDVAAPLAGDVLASCVECHTKHTAVERTFVQFYPTLLDVARQKGTLKPGF